MEAALGDDRYLSELNLKLAPLGSPVNFAVAQKNQV